MRFGMIAWLLMAAALHSAAFADEAISRAWTARNRYQPPPPAIVEAHSQGQSVRNRFLPPAAPIVEAHSQGQSVRNRFQAPAATIVESISWAMTGCNSSGFVDEDGDGVHDCQDQCRGDDFIDADDNGVVDACEAGACCYFNGGLPVCEYTSETVCNNPLFVGDFQGIGVPCPPQSLMVVHEPSGEIITHVIQPAVECLNPLTTGNARRGACPNAGPYIDAWTSPSSPLMCHRFDPAKGGTPIPAGFFNSGSNAFTGSICLQGVPLDNPSFPMADTLITRSADPFDRCSNDVLPAVAGPVSIDITALKLGNAISQPVIVTFGADGRQ